MAMHTHVSKSQVQVQVAARTNAPEPEPLRSQWFQLIITGKITHQALHVQVRWRDLFTKKRSGRLHLLVDGTVEGGQRTAVPISSQRQGMASRGPPSDLSL
eukprot:586565-Prymnesium_polylepis.2